MKEAQADYFAIKSRGKGPIGGTKEIAERFSLIVKRAGGREIISVWLDGVNLETISRWSQGKSRIPLMAAAIVCERTDTPLDWLIYGGSDAAHRQESPEKNSENIYNEIYRKVTAELTRLLTDRGTDQVSPQTFYKVCHYATTRAHKRMTDGKVSDADTAIDRHELLEAYELAGG